MRKWLLNLRRDGDSNPGYPLGVYTLSRRASSTTRAPLLVYFDKYFPIKKQPLFSCFQRRDRDSNPGYLAVQRFSRPPQSTTLPPLQNSSFKKCFSFKAVQRYKSFLNLQTSCHFFHELIVLLRHDISTEL